MANKDLLKQAIAEAKSVREAAIANAKEALEETLTPHLKDMLAAKLQEMEDASSEEVVNESVEEEIEETVEETVEETTEEVNEEETIEEDLTEVPAVAEAEEDEAEDDSEESEDEAEEELPAEEPAEEEAVEGDEDLGDLSVDQFKDMIRDIIAQELGHEGGEELGADLDAGDIEGMGDEEEAIEEPAELDAAADEEEIDLDELLAELEGEISEEEVTEEEITEVEVEEGVLGKIKSMSGDALEKLFGVRSAEEFMQALGNATGPSMREETEVEENTELNEALETIETLRSDLQEVNLLNSKLLYVNKIFKANNLTESQKVNIIAAFDKAETVKEVKLVFETVSENVVATKKENVSESKVKGMASKATGTTASKPEVISEVSDAVRRMQKLAGIIK